MKGRKGQIKRNKGLSAESSELQEGWRTESHPLLLHPTRAGWGDPGVPTSPRNQPETPLWDSFTSSKTQLGNYLHQNENKEEINKCNT